LKRQESVVKVEEAFLGQFGQSLGKVILSSRSASEHKKAHP
jgi:hypothetical protein